MDDQPRATQCKIRKKDLKTRQAITPKESRNIEIEKSPEQGKKIESAAGANKSFSIAEFAQMTYLTEKGVSEWLKTGQLAGQQNDKGDWRIDAANLEKPNVKRLVRET